MATFPRLVNKQFNSPIGLYSQNNIQDTLTKQTQKLQNGAIGIDFNNPINSKPANLANSAVLRMLEEEEARQRSGQPGSLKRVAWPPPAEETDGTDAERQSPPQRQAAPVKTFQSPAISRLIPFDTEPVSHAPPPSQVYSPVPKFSQPQLPQPQSPIPKAQTPQAQTPTQTFPPPFLDTHSTFPRKGNLAYGPVSPRGFVPFDTKAPQTFEPKTFSPVTTHLYEPVPPPKFSPASPQAQKEYGIPPPFSPSSPQILGYPRSEPAAPWAPSAVEPQQDQFVEPPPATVTLRHTAPIHQKPAPLLISQPVAKTFKGGVNMRGDQKWPPQEVKEAVAAENEARISLAKGPACRPRKVRKDYTQFFAKNALPNNYPGYKVPPGTQHYDDQTGTSQF